MSAQYHGNIGYFVELIDSMGSSCLKHQLCLKCRSGCNFFPFDELLNKLEIDIYIYMFGYFALN